MWSPVLRFVVTAARTVALVCLLIGGLCGTLSAATYYVDDSTGSDSSGDGSTSQPWKTLKKGAAALAPGDTLIIRDGVYSGEENNLSGPYGGWDGMPSGSPGNYITIRGESYLGAIIDGGNQYQPIFVWNNSYLVFKNLHLRNTGTANGGANFRAQDCHHIKVLDCASEEAYFGHFWFRNSSYCLVEDCATWGRAAYSYAFVGEYDDYTASQYNVARRCLARHDVHYYPDNQANHLASFVAYWADHSYFFNCLSVDGIHVDDENNVPDDDWIATATFFTTNGASNFHVVDSLAINDVGQSASCSPGDREVIRFENNVMMMNDDSTFGIIAFAANADFSVRGNTLTNARGTGDWQGAGMGEVEGSVDEVVNNLIFDNRIGMLDVSGPHSYNVLYNDVDYQSTSTGPGETTSVDPRLNGLVYPPRVEAGSTLATIGRNGGPAGATIVSQRGAAGTLYGDSGWDTLSAEPLWPWKNELPLAARMGAYSLHGVNGARGFCAGGNGLYGGPLTLSSYVWEYLGAPAPDEYVVGGGGGDCTLSCSATVPSSAAPGTSVGFSATASASDCSGSPTYAWSFGDGAIGSGSSATHTYGSAGSYSWTLTVAADSATCSRSGTIVVSAGGETWTYLVPAVAHNPGAGGTLWRSDVAAVNRSGGPAQITFSFLPSSGSAPSPQTRSLANAATTQWDNVLESVFSYAGSANTSGSLVLRTTAPLVAGARTYNQTPDGTYGQFVPALTSTDALEQGQLGVLPLLRKSSDFRTNIGVINLGDAAVTVRVRLFAAGGNRVGSDKNLSAAAHEWVQQYDIFADVGAGNHDAAYALVSVQTAGGAAWVYASVVDRNTGDAITVPIQIQ